MSKDIKQSLDYVDACIFYFSVFGHTDAMECIDKMTFKLKKQTDTVPVYKMCPFFFVSV